MSSRPFGRHLLGAWVRTPNARRPRQEWVPHRGLLVSGLAFDASILTTTAGVCQQFSPYLRGRPSFTGRDAAVTVGCRRRNDEVPLAGEAYRSVQARRC